MLSPAVWRASIALFVSLTCALQAAAQTAASATIVTPPITNTTTTRTPTITSSSATTSSAPDVYLNVPTLSVGRIELDVDNLSGMR